MSVLVLLNSLTLGGSQLNALDFASRTGPLGFDATLVGWRHTLPPAGPSLVDVAAERGLAVQVLDRPATTRATAALLSRLADDAGAAVVHAYTAWEARPAFWGPCLLGRRALVVTVYEMAVPPEMLPSAALVVGTRYLAEDHAGRRGPMRMISPPVDLARDDPAAVDGDALRSDLGLDPDEVLLVTVTRLDELMKAYPVEVSIGAVERLAGAVRAGGASGAATRPVLAVVGDGDAAQRLRAVAEATNDRLGRPAVRMLGAMADPRPAYAAADVVLGMGGSAARGLAFGKPLVALGERGWSRRVDPDTADAVYRDSFWSDSAPADPVGDLAATLGPLVTSPGTRADLGRFGREFAAGAFGLDAMAERLAGLYAEVASRSWRAGWLHDVPHWMRVPARRLVSRPLPASGPRSRLVPAGGAR